MACCSKCNDGRSTGLGQGREIPYHLTAPEMDAFVDAYSDQVPELRKYLHPASWEEIQWQRQRPYGITIRTPVATYLVWYDESHVLHIVDISGMAIADEIDKQPYYTDDINFLKNVGDQVRKIVSTSIDFMTAATVLLTVYAVYQVYRDFAR